jgi:cysteine synthase A
VNSSNSILECIGSTPLIRLRAASEETGCEILGKAEFLNPGGSVKDRAALGIIREAEAQGRLKPGGLVVEGTAGNTGIGLALVANVLGYRALIVMPDTQSREKVDALSAYGARVAQIPAVPYRNPNHFVHVARRLATELAQSDQAGAIFADQFDNTANRDFHFKTTGPEIWRDCSGRVDGFVCAAGTGGTLAGVGAYLKQVNPGVQIALADPGGSGLHHFYAHGEIKVEGSSISEGIGNSRITGNLAGAPVDLSYSIPDMEALPWVYRLLQGEGLCVGSSSGVNVAGAVRLARDLGPGHTIVTVLCDSGTRYVQKLFNPDFLRARNLQVPDWLQEPGMDLASLFVPS